jgi:hypothetical protein
MKSILTVIIFWFVLSFKTALCFEVLNFKWSGESNFSKSSSESLNTQINLDYKIKIFEPKIKNFLIHLSGSINHDYDHFGNTIKINGFTGFGIDF